MNALQRLTATLVVVLAMVSLVPCAPAIAQTGPATGQYLGESPETIADNTEPGTDAVNDAMSGTTPSATPSASGEASASPAGDTSGSEVDGDGNAQTGSGGTASASTGKGLDSITELPETGGASLVALGSGLLLAMFGLMARRLVG